MVTAALLGLVLVAALVATLVTELWPELDDGRPFTAAPPPDPDDWRTILARFSADVPRHRRR